MQHTMNEQPTHRAARGAFLPIAICVLALLILPPSVAPTAHAAEDTPPAPQSADHAGGRSNSSQQDKPVPLEITGLLEAPWAAGASPTCILGKDDASVGLNRELWVQVAWKQPENSKLNTDAPNLCERTAPTTDPNADGSPSVDAGKYALFLNGTEAKGLRTATYETYDLGGQRHALVFKLKRTNDSKDLWTELLGSPTKSHIPVSVSLGVRDDNGKVSQPTVVGKLEYATFRLQVFAWWRLALAALIVGFVLFVLYGRISKNTTLRDSLLPQIEPFRQSYSLARWQMAFWFTLIFCSFVFLFFLTWDYNTISAQALTLMGISGGTALAAVAVDVVKDSPADAANRGLRALGLNTHEDVIRLKQDITDRTATLAAAQHQLAALAPPPRAKPNPQWNALNHSILHLQTEILGRQGILRTYEDKTRPFLTQGWYKDLTTDLNGTAIHRLQVFCWTWVLGVVYLVGVYRDLAMPNFSAELLALMAISSAGYVGFKYPEKNN